MASFMVFILETSNKDDITLEQRLTQASYKKWLEIYVRRYTSKNKYSEIYPPYKTNMEWLENMHPSALIHGAWFSFFNRHRQSLYQVGNKKQTGFFLPRKASNWSVPNRKKEKNSQLLVKAEWI